MATNEGDYENRNVCFTSNKIKGNLELPFLNEVRFLPVFFQMKLMSSTTALLQFTIF